jgi:hypothetical protein
MGFGHLGDDCRSIGWRRDEFQMAFKPSGFAFYGPGGGIGAFRTIRPLDKTPGRFRLSLRESAEALRPYGLRRNPVGVGERGLAKLSLDPSEGR